ncbi:MAG TPA: pyridoxamine 5'-phosphate oxidase [Polyangiaceae bacterium]
MSETSPTGIPNVRADDGSDAPRIDPLEQFLAWYGEAEKAGAPFADAFALATSGASGRPAVRYVLFKGLVDGALRLVTNFESRKARELDENPHAALAFFWPATGRQVRMEGTVARASDAESDAYFAKRDRVTQLGAWASAQSRPIATRAELEAELARRDREFAGSTVPRPRHWGMLAFTPSVVELWTSGEFRLHDRFRYERDGATWRAARLAP